MKIEPNVLQSKIDEIDKTFVPSTTYEDGELLLTNYSNWSSDVRPKQSKDWAKIKTLLRGIWGKLDWRYKGWVFNHFSEKYNWRGWAIAEAIALRIADKSKPAQAK